MNEPGRVVTECWSDGSIGKSLDPASERHPDVSREETRLRVLGVPLGAPSSRKPWGLIELPLADPDGHAVILVEVPEDHFLRRQL
jgi:hypothetical protein